MRRFRNRWGEPVFQFIACLLQHARDRYYLAGDDDSWLDIPYWVCAYSNNQHAYAPDCPLPSNCPSLPSVAWHLSSMRAGWAATLRMTLRRRRSPWR